MRPWVPWSHFLLLCNLDKKFYTKFMCSQFLRSKHHFLYFFCVLQFCVLPLHSYAFPMFFFPFLCSLFLRSKQAQVNVGIVRGKFGQREKKVRVVIALVFYITVRANEKAVVGSVYCLVTDRCRTDVHRALIISNHSMTHHSSCHHYQPGVKSTCCGCKIAIVPEADAHMY